MAKKYRIGQFVKVKITGIQSYGAFVKTPDNRDGLIHISEVMNDYVHDVNQYLSKGQIVKAKIVSIDENGKISLSLKENEYFKNEEKKRDKRSVLEKIKDTEKYGFQTLAERMPLWIEEAKERRIMPVVKPVIITGFLFYFPMNIFILNVFIPLELRLNKYKNQFNVYVFKLCKDYWNTV